MKTQPLGSILINNYNYGHFLKDAIDSALAQTYPRKEIIVVDDGSTDNSKEVIASYGSQIIPVLKENGGQASAFNAGYFKSKGDIIFFLDADDVFLSNKLTEVVEAFKTYQESGWCFHPLIVSNQINEPDVDNERIPHPSNYKLSEYNLSAKMQQGKLGNPMPFKIPATSGMCFSRSLMEKLLPMPEAEGILLNDTYLKFAAMAISKGIALNQNLAYQRIHGQNSFTLVNDEKIKSFTNIYTASLLKTNFPHIAKFANNIFAVGLYFYQKTVINSEEIKKIINKYLSSLSLLEKLELQSRILYYKLKK